MGRRVSPSNVSSCGLAHVSNAYEGPSLASRAKKAAKPGRRGSNAGRGRGGTTGRGRGTKRGKR